MPKHLIRTYRRLALLLTSMAVFCLASSKLLGQTGVTTINISTVAAPDVTQNVTSPSDAGNDINTSTNYDIRYGQGNNVAVTSYVIGGTTYDRFIDPDTLILLRRVPSDRLVNIWYELNAINTGPSPDQLDVAPEVTLEADAIYLSNNLNAGYDNILVNEDDLASGSIEVETERVDVIWYSGIQSSDINTAVFPVIERGGNDNIAIAAITALDGSGNPSSYGTLVGISSSDWPGTGQTFDDYLILRRETVGVNPIPLINIGVIAGQSAQVVQGVAVSFSELGVSANQSIFGFSLFASDVEGVGGAPAIAAGVDLTDISTFPTTTLSSVSGLDLVAGVAAAVASDDNLIETVGPGGYKAALTTWLKANDGAFVTNGGAASTEGDNVGFWEDQAVGNHDFTTLGTAPTFRSTTSDINFNPTVDFISGSETGLQTPDDEAYNLKAVNDGYTNKGINIAFRTSATDITTKQQIYEEGGGTNGLGIYISGGDLHLSVWNRGGQAQGDWNDDGSGVTTVSGSVALDTEYIITMEFAGDGSGSKAGSITGYLNGASMGSVTNPFGQGVGLLYNHGDDVGLGQHDGGSAYHDGFAEGNDFYGEIPEFIYCNEPGSFALSTRQQIESYLAIKYGITLNQSTAYNYVDSDGDIIFNTTDAASIGGYLEYNNDIAGIGRDDDSELIQLKSKSENMNSIVTMEKTGNIGQDQTWMIWGNDGATTAETGALTMPSTIDMRVTRVWRVAEEKEIGATSVSFDLTELGLSTADASVYSLLVAGTSSNADFSSATVITGGTINSGVITFTGVNLEDGEYFTLGTKFFFCTPGDFDDGIEMWLRADAGVTTATEGSNVTVWLDQTPSGNNGANMTAPIYRATTQLFNDNPNVDFSTGTTGISIANIGPFNVDQSLSKKFSIVFRTGDDITTKQVIYEQGGATRGLNLYIQSGVLHLSAWNQASDGTGAPWNTGTIATVNTSAIAADSEYLVTFDYAGNDAITGTITGYLNGTSFGTPLSSIGRLYGHTDAIGLGDENSASRYADGTTSGAASFDGFIPEMAYYDSPNSYLAADRNRIESALAIKYGLTLDQTSATNYVRADGTTVWDATTNATYNNDIAGIGRDDKSCLNQKQSQSENSGSIVKMGLGAIAATNAANANSFTDDEDFLIWGSDGDFANQANANTSDLPASITERIERIWKVDDTGAVGATEISFDLTGLGYGTSINNFQLIVSNTATMASGSTTPASSYDLGTNTVTFTGVDLTDGQFFTLGTNREVCAPGGVDLGMTLLLKGNVGTTGTSNVTAWEDQSLNTFSVTATTGPELISNGINFNPSLQFNGSNETMVITSGILGTSSPNDLVVFAVTQNNVIQASSIFQEDLASSGRFGSHAPWSDANIYYDYPNTTEGNGRISEPWGSAVGNANLWTLFSSTSSFSTPSGNINMGIFRDGILLDSHTTSSSGTGNNSNFHIGSQTGAANFYDGDIAELLIYNVAPTPQELEQIQTYFAIKYGIFKNSADNGATGGVDERDYFDSNGTVIWDQSVNSSYHQDVAGIGRDDQSCLNQKQSSSEATDDILAVGLGSVAADNASNVNSFVDDGDFFVWGNDGGATAQASANTVDVPSSVAERMTRVWRVEDTGLVGATELEFDLTGLGYGSTASDFRLIISNSPTMASGTLTAGGTFNGSVLSFSGIDLTDGQYFTLATALETCGPGGVNTNLALWLRADLEAFSDLGSTAATDGDNVLQINDQSSPADNGLEVDLGGAGPIEPTFETSEINFNPVLRFIDPNSSNSSYIETSSNSVSGDMTLVSIFQSGQTDGTQDDFVNSPALIGASETSGTADYALGMENGNLFVNASTGITFDAETSGTYNDNLPHMALATRVQSSGAIKIFVTGATAATGTGSTSALSDPTSFGIGNHSDGDIQAQYAGDIAESIVFSSVLTGEEQSRVETYLALKYGLTISNNRDGDGTTNEVISGLVREGDYVAGDGGVVWDHLNQGPTYHNDIFGIARDDLSCFEQIKSKSESSDAMVTFDNDGSFSANDSWLISGNDNAPIEAPDNKERPATIASRLNREWRVQETGTVGQIKLTYDLSSVTGTPLGDNNLNLVKLMVDDDGDFTTGVTLIDPTTIDGGAKTVTFLVNFTDGQYYTLGSTEVDALPITLIAFDTRATSDNKVEITWATAQEIDNSFFSIERSRDGINFETIGFKEGAGNSNSIIDYTFIDEEPLDGVSYYRLKQTDFNGQFDYSSVSRISLNLPQSSVHQVVPNPINRGENFKVTYPVTVEQDVRVSISNANGINTYNKLVTIKPEDGEIEVTTSNLAKGLYFIRIINQNLDHITLKFIIR